VSTPPLDFLQTPTGMPGAPGQMQAPMIPQPSGMQPQGRPSLWQRIVGGLSKTRDFLAGPDYAPPPEMAQFMTPEQIMAAQQQANRAYADAKLSGGGVNAANAAMIGQSTFDNVLANAVKVSQFARENRLADEERAKTTKMEAERDKIMARLMAGVNTQDASDVARRLNAALPELLRIGDTKGYSSLSGYLAANNALLRGPQAPEMDVRVVDNVLGEDGKPYIVGYDNNTDAEVWRKPQFVPPRAAPDNSGRMSNTEARLANDYMRRIKKPETAAEYVRAVEESKDQARRMDGAAQHSLIVSYFHVLEPESVVREGEFGRLAAAYGLSQRLQVAMQRVDKGGFLTPNEVDSIHQEVARISKSHQRSVKEAKRQFDARARKLGLDPDLITYDPFNLPDLDAPEGALGGPLQAVVPPTGKAFKYDK
jgi:hypothetical protein